MGERSGVGNLEYGTDRVESKKNLNYPNDMHAIKKK
jgi:hypothetical protein